VFRVLCYLRALMRLVYFSILFFMHGLDHVLFNATEIAGFKFYVDPFQCDKERLAYVDSLYDRLGYPTPQQGIGGNEEDIDEEPQHS